MTRRASWLIGVHLSGAVSTVCSATPAISTIPPSALKLIIVGGGSGSSQGTPPGGPAAGGTPDGSKNSPATPLAASAKAVTPPAPGPASALTGLTAMIIEGADGNKSSRNSFCWEGNEDGLEFKPNNAVSLYLTPQDSASFPLCCHATVGIQPDCSFSKSEFT